MPFQAFNMKTLKVIIGVIWLGFCLFLMQKISEFTLDQMIAFNGRITKETYNMFQTLAGAIGFGIGAILMIEGTAKIADFE